MLLKGNLTGFQHLGIVVTDITAVRDWYVNTLGFTVTHEDTVNLGEDLTLAFLQLGNVVLELIAFAETDVSGRGHGKIDHFAIDALDIESAMQTGLSRGAVLHESTPDGVVTLPDLGPKGTRYVFFEGPAGEKVEIAQSMHFDPARRTENIMGWNHMGIFVTDLAASKAFYEQFGFEERIAGTLTADSGTVHISMLGFGDFVIELVQFSGADMEEIKARQAGRIDHVAFDVQDIDAAYAELKEAGMNMQQDAPVPVPLFDHGVKYFMITGPDGELVEFNQVLKG